MKNNKREILKQLLKGELSSKKAAAQLKKEINPHRGFWLFTTTPNDNGLYSGNGYTNITEDEARAIAGDESTIFFLEQLSTVIPGKDDTFFVLPDNGR
jgi:hypothetical protein